MTAQNMRPTTEEWVKIILDGLSAGRTITFRDEQFVSLESFMVDASGEVCRYVTPVDNDAFYSLRDTKKVFMLAREQDVEYWTLVLG